MRNRLELHAKLKEVIGNNNVYNQPPASVVMQYPCIVYYRNDIENKFASDDVYIQSHHYRVIVIDTNPNSQIVEKMSKFKTAKYENHYVNNNLYHDVFSVFY